MKFLLLTASPRPNGNTAELLKPFMATLEGAGAEIQCLDLPHMNILPCKGCFACQPIKDRYGCVIEDDVPMIMNKILSSDVLVLASPIYSWYCTTPMKSFLDRHFGMNKYYYKGERKSLWQGKKVALITTHGYDREYGAGPFETGIIRLCEHSGLQYLGMYSVQDERGLNSFRTQEAIEGAQAFAEMILNHFNVETYP